MAIVANTSPSTPPSINSLVLLAYKRAGLVGVNAQVSGADMVPKLEHGRQLLDLIMDNLVVEGFTARLTTFHDLPIVAGESYYQLPDTALDVIEDAMFVPSDNADTKHTTGEGVVKQVDLSTWNLLTTKGSTSSRPTMYLAKRDGPVPEVRLWPVPTEAGTVRLKVIRHFGANSDGAKNPDLQRYWLAALVWLLAADLAVDNNQPSEKVTSLRNMAAVEKKKCVAYSMEHTSVVAQLNYPTQWRC